MIAHDSASRLTWRALFDSRLGGRFSGDVRSRIHHRTPTNHTDMLQVPPIRLSYPILSYPVIDIALIGFPTIFSPYLCTSSSFFIRFSHLLPCIRAVFITYHIVLFIPILVPFKSYPHPTSCHIMSRHVMSYHLVVIHLTHLILRHLISLSSDYLGSTRGS